ncbi:MAG: MFS transporter [Actinomycetota bacterium]
MGLLTFEGENAREKAIVLLTMCFALAMVMLDNTVVNVALPTLSKDLEAGVSQLQWIVDGYVLALASLLLTGGILGDRYGRKRTFLLGLAIFTLSSLACGLSSSSGMLIAFRATQGVGAALLLPGTLSILTVTFPPNERARAIGLWAGVSGLALALGPTLGGWMVENLGWQSVFFLNVPIGIIGFLVATSTVRESTSDQVRRIDVPGLLLGTGSLFFVTYGLIEANQFGWSDPRIWGSLVLGAVLLGSLLTAEHRSDHAMMPLPLFRIPAFSAGNLVAFSIALAMFGTFFFLSLYMQLIRLYSAFEAGLSFLPLTLMIIVTAPNAGRYAQRHGSRAPMTFGLVLAGTGLLLLSFLTPTTPYLVIAPILFIMGLGMGATMAPMTAAVMNAVGPQRAGLGSAMTNTSREVGGVFGIALLGTILTTRLGSAFNSAIVGLPLTQTQTAALEQSASHGTLEPAVLHSLPATVQGSVAHVFSDAFMSGFHVAVIVAGVVMYVAAFAAYRFIPAGAHGADASHAAAQEQEPVAAH